MKKLLALLFILLGAYGSLSAVDVTKISAGLDEFMKDLTVTVPSIVVNQNVYADAYIGKLIPSIPPHLALGVNSGFAVLNMTGLRKAGNEMNLSIPENFALPSFTVDARLGGLFLPFDIGITFMKIPSNNLGILQFEYLTWGADLRWALMQQNIIKPNISLGFAYYQSRGKIQSNKNDSAVSIAYNMNTLAFSAQISKTFAIITPFFGSRFVMSEANNSYDWKSSVINGSKVYEKSFGDLNQFHIYGGLSINIFLLRLTPSISYDFSGKVFSGAFSARIQF